MGGNYMIPHYLFYQMHLSLFGLDQNGMKCQNTLIALTFGGGCFLKIYVLRMTDQRIHTIRFAAYFLS